MKTLLFDLDGTLSEARESVSLQMAGLLEEASKHYTIGIVSGSDIDFIIEQIAGCFTEEFLEKILIMPCNGTKKYFYGVGFEEESSVDMIEQIGKSRYYSLLMLLLREQQSFMMDSAVGLGCTGKFFDYRGSMINWSPMGRNGDVSTRSEFIQYDKASEYRKKVILRLEDHIRENELGVVVKLGGDTSFDIYPEGWDKTYCLNHVSDSIDDVAFFGDRCFPGGNDYEISKAVKKSYQVKGPDETMDILRKEYL